MGKQKTNEQFILESILKHGNKYDYSKVFYTNKNNKVIITCKIHGDFEQCANSHLHGYGCQKCGGNFRYNKDGFIEKAKLIHGDMYDYSKVNYKNNQTKIIIICKEHGEFLQTPNGHLSGYGCYICGHCSVADKRRKNVDTFIKESIKKHGEFYDYSKVNYKNCKTKVIIICKEHGEFLQTPTHHLRGQGCLKCNGNHTLSENEFIEKANNLHNNFYDYSQVKFISNKTHVNIICKNHGLFKQLPYIHLKGHGCKKCGTEISEETKLKRQQLFIEKSNKIHNYIYDYSKVEYIGSDKKVEIICKNHGSFYKTPDNHTHINYPQGCPKCQTIKQYSKMSIDWLKFCEKYYNITIQHAENYGEYNIPNSKYKADGYCESINTIFEFHGSRWHGDPSIYDKNLQIFFGTSYGTLYENTIKKENFIKDSGYNLIVMWESKWKQINKCIKIIQKRYKEFRNLNSSKNDNKEGS